LARDLVPTKGKSNAKCGSGFVDADWLPCRERCGARSNVLQGMRRAAKGMHEELCRAGLQDRVPDVSQSLQKVSEAKLGSLRFIAVLAGIGSLVALNAGFAAAESAQKLSGAQIRAKFVGMQLTDEVHYRFAYERDGTLRSFALGAKKRGMWVIDKDQLCLYLQERDDGCFEVARSGKTFTLTPVGLGSPLDGILQPISDPQ
jgi:hypothetical protein